MNFIFLFAIFFAIKTLPEKLGSLRMPQELNNIEIEDKSGASIPTNIELIDANGEKHFISEYFNNNNKIPIILLLGYYGCPMLCSLVQNGFSEAVKNISFKPGKDFKIISVSIDPKEDHNLAQKKQEVYHKLLDIKIKDAWKFYVTDEKNAKALSKAVGFNYYFDKKNNQYAHGAGFFVISPNGVLSRTFYGITFSKADLKLAIQEASQGKIGSFLEKVILSCFHYNPDSRKYGIYIIGVMRIFGLLTILVLLTTIILNFRNEAGKWKT